MLLESYNQQKYKSDYEKCARYMIYNISDLTLFFSHPFVVSNIYIHLDQDHSNLFLVCIRYLTSTKNCFVPVPIPVNLYHYLHKLLWFKIVSSFRIHNPIRISSIILEKSSIIWKTRVKLNHLQNFYIPRGICSD